jgi:hypothetical protein
MDFTDVYNELSKFMKIDTSAKLFADMFSGYEVVISGDFFHVYDGETELCTLMFCADGLTDIFVLPNFVLNEKSLQYLPYVKEEVTIVNFNKEIYLSLLDINKRFVIITTESAITAELNEFIDKYGDLVMKNLVIDERSTSCNSLSEYMQGNYSIM